MFDEYAGDLDVNVAPLACGNPFCESKSEDLAYFEPALLVEVPTVAAATQPFRAAIKDGENGYATCSSEGWHHALTALIAEPRGRQRIGRAARREALATYGPEARAIDRRRTFEAIMEDQRVRDRALDHGGRIIVCRMAIGAELAPIFRLGAHPVGYARPRCRDARRRAGCHRSRGMRSSR